MKEDLEKRRARQRKAYAADPEKHRRRCRAYYRQNLQAQQQRVRTNARRLHGLPEPTRPEPSVCECCEKPSGEALCIDHDHVSGAFRGWLCKACNRGIGSLGDALPGVEKAAAYLKRV